MDGFPVIFYDVKYPVNAVVVSGFIGFLKPTEDLQQITIKK